MYAANPGMHGPPAAHLHELAAGAVASSPNAAARAAKPITPRSLPCAPQAPAPEPQQHPQAAVRRRNLLAVLPCLLAAAACPPGRATATETGAAARMTILQAAAARAYGERDFTGAVSALDQLLQMEPKSARWLEMRAQALVDGKRFGEALRDFDAAIALTPAGGTQLDTARLLAGRGLAYEGIGDWVSALADYSAALAGAEEAGAQRDPYVLNSMGNCHASLGEWREARADYLESATAFQGAAGLHGSRGGATPRLDGAVFASSNAALMAAQLGDEAAALREMQAIARRAPGSVDMRAALAAMYWGLGREQDAESEWEFACQQITAGCTKYQDEDWLFRIRRWPPAMVARLREFLQLRSQQSRGGGVPAPPAAPARLNAAGGAGFRE